MYNLLEYSKIYSKKKTGSSWIYYRDEPNSGAGGANNNINDSIKYSKSFNHKTCITRKLEDNNAEKEKVKIVVSLKRFIRFWGALDMSLINCSINHIFNME